MKAACPKCKRVYETDLAGFRRGTIVCECGAQFECYVEDTETGLWPFKRKGYRIITKER